MSQPCGLKAELSITCWCQAVVSFFIFLQKNMSNGNLKLTTNCLSCFVMEKGIVNCV